MTLFESVKFGNRIIKNRIVVSSYINNIAERGGRVSQQQYDNLISIAKQGAGTIIVDSAYVCQQGKGLPLQLGISEEEHVSGLRKLVKLIKESGVFIGQRLSHAGAKTNLKLCGEKPIGPSVIHFGKEFEQCREFDEHDVAEVCTFFGHAAERAEEAGFDFIEINSAQNTLLDQCLNKHLNSRDDNYGGDVKGRMQFATDIIRFIKKRVDKKMLLGFFVSNPLETIDEAEGLVEWLEILKILAAEKIDFIHPDMAHAISRYGEKDRYLIDFIANNSQIPIIVDGLIKTTVILKELLKLDKATFYAIDKSFLQRPNWYQFIQKKINS